MLDEQAFRAEAGEQLRIGMAIRRLSQMEMGIRSGVAAITVGRHIRAETPMTQHQANRYAEVLDMRWSVDPGTGLPRLDSNQQPADSETQPEPMLAEMAS